MALDLVGAAVLSHAHNLESTLELRDEISGDERALGEKDAIATHARLLSEKRVGFLILAIGLALYLAGLVLGTSVSFVWMAVFAAGVLALGLGAAALWIKVGTKRVIRQTHEAARREDTEGVRVAKRLWDTQDPFWKLPFWPTIESGFSSKQGRHASEQRWRYGAHALEGTGDLQPGGQRR